MADSTIRIVLLTDVRLLREGLTPLLDATERLRVVATAGTLDEAHRAAETLQPDLLLLDVSMRDALETARALRATAARIPLVAFAVEDDETVLAYAEAGVVAYVPRSAGLGTLVATLEGVSRGEALCSPYMAGSLFRRVAALANGHAGAATASTPPLTLRELDVVRLLDAGLSNKEIAQRLEIGVPTVKNHVHHILEKLQVTHRGAAMARLRRGDPAWSRGEHPVARALDRNGTRG